MRFLPTLALLAVLLTACSGTSSDDASSSAFSSSRSSTPAPVYSQEEREMIARMAQEAASGSVRIGSGSSSVSALTTDDDVVRTLLHVTSASSASGGVIQLSDVEERKMMAREYTRRAALGSVDGGPAYGIARADFHNGTFRLFSSFIELPPLTSPQFYEGWLIRSKPFSALSVGRVESVHGTMVLMFASGDDLELYDRFILTRRSGSGASRTGEPILEGAFRPID